MREASGISRFDLADSLAVVPDVVAGWEDGSIVITELDSTRIQSALEVLTSRRETRLTRPTRSDRSTAGPSVLDRLRYGVLGGLAFGAALLLIAVIFQTSSVLRGGNAWSAYGTSFWQLALVYLSGSMIGGIVVALVFPICRSMIGSAFLGFLLVLPMYAAAAISLSGFQDFQDDGWKVAIFLSVIVGIPLGTITWWKHVRGN